MPETPKRATALRWTGTGAPQVVAAGRGAVAEKILEQAQAAGVPVREDPGLADALAQLALGDEVPEAMWTAVAQVLAWAYGLDGKAITTNG